MFAVSSKQRGRHVQHAWRCGDEPISGKKDRHIIAVFSRCLWVSPVRLWDKGGSTDDDVYNAHKSREGENCEWEKWSPLQTSKFWVIYTIHIYIILKGRMPILRKLHRPIPDEGFSQSQFDRANYLYSSTIFSWRELSIFLRQIFPPRRSRI